MRPQDILIGSIISFVVSGLKKIRFVREHPKVVSAVLSTAVPAGIAIYSQIKGVDLQGVSDLVASAATQFASSVATHETVTHTVNKVTGQSEDTQ
jgi:hypothetical protein